MLHFSMFVPTKATVKLDNGNTGYDQGIRIILCIITNCFIIYPVVTVYYCPYHPSNTISSGTLKCFVGFQKVTYKPLENCDFVDPQGHYWISPYHNQNNLDQRQIKIVKVNPQRNRNIVVPTVNSLSKQNVSQIIHQRFGHVSIVRTKRMARKGLTESLPTNIPDLQQPFPIFLLTKAKKITSGPTIYVSKFAHGFILQIDFPFLNVESIHGFTSTFVHTCSSNSHPFGFISRSNRPPLEIINFLVTTLRNQNKKSAFIRVDEYESIARSSEFMKTCHNMNIIVKTTGGYESSLNGKTKTPNKNLANITIFILLSSSHKKKLW